MCPKCHSGNPETQKFCGECGTQLGLSEDPGQGMTRTLETPASMLTTGATFAGRYQVIEELGEGGMGKVYKVLDKEIEARIALKLIKPEVAADPKTIERFRNELKTARDISHKNVCRMYHLGRHEGNHYITMEFVDGEDLKSTIRRVGPLGAEKAVAIAHQVCEGLAEAHRMGVVHRDLKPANIMIDKDGSAKIMDFGIARSIKAKGLTGPGIMIGTPEYMPPEQTEGKEVDHRSDIYSLGVILFEMLTGNLPFEGDTPLSIAMKHKSEPPPDPRDLNSQIPEDLSRLILRCMEKEKQARYQSVREIQDELERIGRGMPTTRREAVRTKSKRKPFVLALVGIALIIAVLIIWKAWSKKGASPTSSGIPFIAVLPFEDQSPQKDQEYFCNGMTDQIITNLTRIPELKVIARQSVMSFKNAQKDIREISQELGVKYLLEGRIRKVDDQLRVSAALLDAESGVYIWADDYNRELDDIFEIQDDVSESIAGALQITLSDQTNQAIKAGYPQSVEAYDTYLKARHYVESRYMSTRDEGDFQQAMELAKRAVELDPEFALGYVGLAYMYENRWVMTNDDQDLVQENAYILKAYELDPDLPETNAAMGMMYTRQKEYEKAFSHLRFALDLNANNWEVLTIFGAFYMHIGLFDQAIEYLRKAIEMNPLNIFPLSNAGLAAFLMGELDQALEYMEKSYRIQPNYVWNLTNYALALILKQEYRKAEEILDLAEAQPQGIASSLSLTRTLYLALTEKEDRAAAKEWPGIVQVVLGRKNEALDYIENLAKTESPYNVYLTFCNYLPLVNLPIYDYLRSDPRFQDIVRKEKEKYEQKLKKYRLPSSSLLS